MALPQLTSSDAGASARDKINLAIAEADRVAALSAALAAIQVQLAPYIDLVGSAPDRPGDSRTLFTRVMTGDPKARPALDKGTVADGGELGQVLRISGADTDPGLGYIDVAPRRAYYLRPGRAYLVQHAFARFQDPSDPEQNAVELRFQNLSSTFGIVSNVRLGNAYAPTVADGSFFVDTFIGKAGAPGTPSYTIPATARYGVPFFRVYGNGHQTDLGTIRIYDVSDALAGGADIASILTRLKKLEDGQAVGITFAADWNDLKARVGRVAGAGARTPDSDTGTHTDPVTGALNTPNAGNFLWSVTPPGWKWVSVTDARQAAIELVRSTARYWPRPGEAITTWTSQVAVLPAVAAPLAAGGAFSLVDEVGGKALRITGEGAAGPNALIRLEIGSVVEIVYTLSAPANDPVAANNVPLLYLQPFDNAGAALAAVQLPSAPLLNTDPVRSFVFRASRTKGAGTVDLPDAAIYLRPYALHRGTTGALAVYSVEHRFMTSDVAGLETRTADLPATLITNTEIYDEENKRVAIAAVGSEGRGPFYITDDGSVVIGRASHEIVDLDDTTIAHAEVDRNYRAIRIVYTDGTVAFPGGLRGVATGGGGSVAASRGPQVAPSLKYRLVYGQSLATGTGGLPLLSIVPMYGTKMFAGGVRLLHNTDLTAFVDAVETKDGALGETGAVASAHQSVRQWAVLSGANYPGQGFDYFVASGGRGGAPLSRLAKGDTYYTNMLTIAANALPIALASGRTFAMSLIEMIHGQADAAFGTTRAAYANGLVKFRQDLEADTKAQTGQPGVIPMLVSQAGCQAAYHLRMSSSAPTERAYPAALPTPEVDMAMMDAAAVDPNIIVHMSLYCTGYLDGGDGIHRGSEDYRMIGRNRGRAAAKIEKALADGTPYPEVAVRPLSYIAQRRSIRIKMSVPHGPLVFDTSWVLATFNYGFDIWDVSGPTPTLVDIIDAVEIVGKDTVEIRLNGGLPAFWRCTYAWGRNESANGGRSKGPRGNLRDSEGDAAPGTGNTYVDGDGVTRRLDNYCLLFALSNKA